VTYKGTSSNENSDPAAAAIHTSCLAYGVTSSGINSVALLEININNKIKNCMAEICFSFTVSPLTLEVD
jgi:hypothetical protein